MTGREPTIALVGNPNVGKSTLFNRITGARQRAVNAPGTTVQVATGHWRAVGARVLDLPGTYSLIATSPDEQVVTDTVSGAPGSVTDPNAGLGVDLILVILDGSSMTRSLYLLAQVAQTGRPAVAVVTMADVAEQNGEPVNVNALAKKLGIPVMAFDPRSGRDSAVLEQMIATALVTRPRVNGIVPDPNAPGYSADAAAEALASAGLPERGEREDLIGDAGCGCGCGCSDGSGKKSDGQTPGREESGGAAEAAADGRAAAAGEREAATGAGRADHEQAARNLSAEAAEFARVAQEFDHFDHVCFRLIGASNVGKGYLDFVFRNQAGAAFAKGKRAALATALNLAGGEHKEPDEQQNRQQINEDTGKEAFFFQRLAADVYLVGAQVADESAGVSRLRVVGGKARAAAVGETDARILQVNRRTLHLAVIHAVKELRIADLARAAGCAEFAHLADEQQEQQDEPAPDQ